ncbi:MAG: hypothetical protein LBS07_00625, partial [Prevotellaceae bacterium]|nr:hypothetical protein [Prevotellaceae bacterium]
MNTKLFIKTMFLSVLISTIITDVHAQVTIGANEAAEKGALLQLKNVTGITTGDANATGGFLYPRVALRSRTSLQPLVTAVEDVESAKTRATGMTVFNTASVSAENLDLGLYLWNGTEWILTASAIGMAESSITNVEISGTYVKEQALNVSNFLTLTLNVTKRGKYEVHASTDNGYYFTASGEFLGTGTQVITATGNGMPVKSTTDKKGVRDVITVKINAAATFDLKNTVNNKVAKYSMNCLTTQVHGIYKPDQVFTTDNYITVKVVATADSNGAEYSMKTDEVNGYSFSASGMLSAGEQTLYLTPTRGAKPLRAGSDYFTITSNSASNSSTCSFSIQIMSEPLKITSIGGDAYRLFNTGRGNDVPINPALYGTNGTYNKILGFTVATAIDNETYLTAALKDNLTDIVVMGYNVTIRSSAAGGNNIPDAITAINSGRVVIHATDGPSAPGDNADELNRADGVKQILMGIFDGLTEDQISWKRSV